MSIFNFDKVYEVENNFAKNNPEYLLSMFDTTDVIPLWIADMDFKIAPTITHAIDKLANRGIYAYELNTDTIYKAIADWYEKRHNLTLHKSSFIQVPSVLTGIAVLIQQLTNIGDTILIQTPVYHQFYKVIKSAGRNVVKNPLQLVDGKYFIDFDNLELQLKTSEIKLMLFCNPHNPVGRVWKSNELQKLIDLANRYKVIIISDEIHADIIYSKSKFNSIVSLDSNNKHIALLGSPAKTFGMQSISDGYLYISNSDLYQRIKQVVGSMYLDHGNIFSTNATIAAYTKGEEWLDELLVYLENTLDWIEEFIENKLPQVVIHKPEGTYQIWLDFSRVNLSDKSLKDLIFKEAKLALTPGDWFEDTHKQYMRMNIASPLSKIQKAFFQLKSAIDSVKA